MKKKKKENKTLFSTVTSLNQPILCIICIINMYFMHY